MGTAPTIENNQKEVNNIGFYDNENGYEIYPREKHAIFSVITFRPQDLLIQDEYIERVQSEYQVQWLKEKSSDFRTEVDLIIWQLNAQFHRRGRNKVLECLQFGGNREFWRDFPDEEEIGFFFRHCYDFATEIVKCADKAVSLDNMKRLFDVFVKEVIFDGERFLIIMKTTDKPLDREKGQKEEATRKKFELLRFGDPTENRTRVTAVKGRCLDRLTMGPVFGRCALLLW